MTRVAAARPPAEHLAVVSRVYRQVAADRTMGEKRRKALLGHLTAAQRLLEAELEERMLPAKGRV